ncbi:hypothetical protein GGR57DRAFT_367253 [Xylariaceae sp. FL1272]|nr:hypothetical protein GGR57DRAFT_367253 [Xylariaceae sp. FL1272]
MALSLSLLIFAFLALAHANPTYPNTTYPQLNGTNVNITQPDPCTVYNRSSVKMNYEYTGNDCPARVKFSWQDLGQCQADRNLGDDCLNSFCQVNTTYTYAREVPIMGTYCTGPLKCGVTYDDSVIVERPKSPGVALAAALRRGVSGGWNATGVRGAPRFSLDAEVPKDACGYWTFVPIMKTVCGTWSHAPKNVLGMCGKVVNDVGCVSQLVPREDGTLEGETLFINTQCGTNLPLAKKWQDHQYRHEGVALDDSVVARTTKDWQQINCTLEFNLVCDRFNMHGKNWAKSRLGLSKRDTADGSRLMRRLRGCGLLTGWYFAYHDDDTWSAYGNLPLARRNCIGDKLIKLGAVSRGQCHEY